MNDLQTATVVVVGVTTFALGVMLGYLFGCIVGFRTAQTLAMRNAKRMGLIRK